MNGSDRELERAGLRRPGLESADSQRQRLPTEAMLALQSGRKLEAIRIAREQTGMSLLQAKDMVDQAGQEHEPGVRHQPGKEDSGTLRLVAILAVLGAVVAAAFFL